MISNILNTVSRVETKREEVDFIGIILGVEINWGLVIKAIKVLPISHKGWKCLSYVFLENVYQDQITSLVVKHDLIIPGI